MTESANKKHKSPKTEQFEFVNGSKTSKVEDVNIEEKTPAFMLKRINALKNVQLKMVDLESKFFEELHQLECKYAKIYEPLYDSRKSIVVGTYEPTEEEGKWALDEASMTAEEKAKKAEDDKNAPEDAEKTKGITNFWLETLQSFRITAEIIQEHDEPILAFLQDIRVNMSSEKPYGYTLEFHFTENPYFTGTVLTKHYELKTEVDPKDPFAYEGPDLKKTTGCKINWLAGKNPCVKMTRKKIKGKNKKAPAKVIHKEEKQDSFFNFFDTPKHSKSKDAKEASSGGEDNRKVSMRSDDGDMDEEDQEELYMIADFEIGQYLREKVVPKAVLYYTGEYDGLEDDEYEDYDEDEEGDDEEGDDDEDDDEDEEEDDEDDHRGKKGGKGGKKPLHKAGAKPAHSAKGGEPTPSECKQN